MHAPALSSAEIPLTPADVAYHRIMRCIKDKEIAEENSKKIREILKETFQHLQLNSHLKDNLIKTLGAINEELNLKVIKIQTHQTTLEKNLENLTLVSSNIENVYKQLQIKYEQTSKENETVTQNFTHLQNNYDSLKKNFLNLEENVNDLSSQKTRLETEVGSLSSKYKDLSGSYTALETQHDLLKDASADLNQKYGTLNQRYADLDLRTTVLKTDYDQLNQDYVKLQDLFDKAIEKNKIQGEEIQGQNKKITVLRKHLGYRVGVVIEKNLWMMLPSPFKVIYRYYSQNST